MSDLVAPIKDGQVQSTSSSTSSQTKSTDKTGSKLDKDAFLQLLVTQMKYQDPLNPSSNTEYVAQLATFSQLEQLQNLSDNSSKTQALSLVGKTVDVTTTNATGNQTTITGRVDYVSISNGKAQLSINGSLYPVDQLSTVLDSNYLTEQGLPAVDQTTLKYDSSNPSDQKLTVNLGSGSTVADKVAVAINGNVVDSSLVSLSGNKVTIDKSAFANLQNGTYKITVAFNDSLYTTIKDKVTVQVTNTGAAGSTTNTISTTNTDSTDPSSTATDNSGTDSSGNSTDAVTT